MTGRAGMKNVGSASSFRRIGEPPVILDTTLVEQSTDELRRFFINKGYVNAEVSAEIDTSRQKKAVVIYKINSNEALPDT